MIFIVCYLMIGLGVYIIVAHICSQYDHLEMPSILLILDWPIVYLLRLIDLVDWFIKEMRRDE